MSNISLKTKLHNALRIDRAIRLVWQAGAGWTVASAAMVTVQGAIPLLSLYLIKLIIDAVSALLHPIDSAATQLPGGFTKVIAYIGLAGGVGLFTAVCGYFAEYVKKAQSLTVTDFVLTLLHSKSIALDLSYYESSKFKDTLHRAQQEGPYRPTSIVNGLVSIGQNGVSLLAVLLLLFSLNPWLPLGMIAAVVPGILMRFRYSAHIYHWQERHTEDERKAQYFSWILTGESHAREVRLFGLGNYFIEQFNNIRDSLRSEKIGLEKRRAFCDLVAQASITIAVFGCFSYIALATVRQTIGIGDMVMYFQAVQRGITFLSAFLMGTAALYEDNLFLSHFYDLMDIHPDIGDPEHPKTLPKRLTSGVSVENISFKYQDTEKVILNNLSFSIKPGKIVALVGENGAGKSTIVKLLCRLYDPTAGSVRMEGIDIREFPVREYRKRISVVFQDYIRYYLTARENIWVGDVAIDQADSRVKTAAQKSGISEYIERLESGIDTPLGRWLKGGAELSTGQWQMVALARAFFRDADLVILDEPASSLDVHSEARVFDNFRELIKGKTGLIISHRFSTVKMADTILLLRSGKIVEEGSHAELMKLNGEYATLYCKQAVQYQDS